MKVVGLTGGVGMGKSAAADFLGQWQIPVIDTDLLARELVQPGQPALDEIRAAFGPGMLDARGQLDRAALAEVVFADPAKRRDLEQILHPRIRRQWQEQVAQERTAGKHGEIVVAIPLLFETRCEAAFDFILCVACSAGAQAERLQARGWDATQQAQRIAAQWPTDQKMELAHAVIWTEPDLTIHQAQIEKVVRTLRSR